MEQKIKVNLLNSQIWIRLIYMIVFALLSALARIIICVVAVLQFIFVLLTGKDNNNLRNLGQGIAKWVYQAYLFLTFNSESKPFPFADWPGLDQPEFSSTEILDGEIVESDEVTDSFGEGGTSDVDDSKK